MAKPTPCSRRLLAFILVFFWTTLLKAPGAAAQQYSNCNGSTSFIGDAICDITLNNEDCGYDGGDCCECTCIDTVENSCGSGTGFFCTDPNVPSNCSTTTNPTPSPTPAPEVDPYADCEGYLPHLQDGYCDSDLNVAECGWDGGDCCVCTCLEDLTHECGQIGDGFDCKDPDAPTDCNEALLSDCTGYLYDYQDGYCDDELNNEECAWDGGDCCR